MNKLIELKFPKTLFVYCYMEYDWSMVNTFEDMLNFYHKWHNDMLTSKNKERIMAIKSIIYPLYSKITNKSFESKIQVA